MKLRSDHFRKIFSCLIICCLLFPQASWAEDPPASPSPLQKPFLDIKQFSETELPDGFKTEIQTDDGMITITHRILDSQEVRDTTSEIHFEPLLQKLRNLKEEGIPITLIASVPKTENTHASLENYIREASSIVDDVYVISEPQPILKSTRNEFISGVVIASVEGIRNAFVYTMYSGILAGGLAMQLGTGLDNTFSSIKASMPMLIATFAGAIFGYIAIKRRALLAHIFRWKDDAILSLSSRYASSPAVGEILSTTKKFMMGMLLTAVTSSLFFTAADFLNHANPDLASYNPSYKPFMFDYAGNFAADPLHIFSTLFATGLMMNVIGLSWIALTNEEGRGNITRRFANSTYFFIFLTQNTLFSFYILDFGAYIVKPLLGVLVGLGALSMLVPWDLFKYIFGGGELRLDYQGRRMARSFKELQKGQIRSDGHSLAGEHDATWRFKDINRGGYNGPQTTSKLTFDPKLNKWIVSYSLGNDSFDILAGTLHVRDPGKGERVRYTGYKRLDQDRIAPLTVIEGERLWDAIYADVHLRSQDLEVVLKHHPSFWKRVKNIFALMFGRSHFATTTKNTYINCQ